MVFSGYGRPVAIERRMLVRRVDCRLHPFRTDQRFTGVIESADSGVTPDPDVIGKLEPDVRRTLNWVHIAARIENPPLELLRIGETPVVTIRER
jgi:hypothetical protein